MKNQQISRAELLKGHSLGSVERIMVTIEGFRASYGHWPTVVQIPAMIVDDIKKHVLTPQGWTLLLNRIELNLSEHDSIVASDASGRIFEYQQYSYAKHSAKLDTHADNWIWGLNLSGS